MAGSPKGGGALPFSPRQMELLTWWTPWSPHRGRDGVVCHGAVRSGKTFCMGLSFAAWAMAAGSGRSYALCGKTRGGVERNLLGPLLPQLRRLGFGCRYQKSRGLLRLAKGGRENDFWLFGGRDEGAGALIQGVTLAGVLLDEVALMPRSFVEQAVARCSVEGSRLWFNCNPEHPGHWFYREWILGAAGKNALVLHFRMEDNPSLSPAMLERYRRLYSGPFYQRYVLGEWAAASGAVYPFFSRGEHIAGELPQGLGDWYISCDYGTVNPCSMGLWGRRGEVWYRVAEYYHDSRRAGVQHTDEEYYAALEALAGGRPIRGVVVDPSAASFLECIRRRGKYRAIPAVNQVADGIRRVSQELRAGRLMIGAGCADAIREFGQYRWAEGKADQPVKEHDHAMDDIRYFVSTVVCRERGGGFWVGSVERRRDSGVTPSGVPPESRPTRPLWGLNPLKGESHCLES